MTIRDELADGRVLEFPDGTDPSVIQTTVKRMISESPVQTGGAPQEGITAALTGGFKRFLSTGETAAESLINPELAAQRGVERSRQIGEQYAPGASLEKVKQAYESEGLFPAIKEGISQIPAALAEQAPQIAATLGSARLGAMAGSPLGPVGAVVGGVAGAVAPSLVQLYGSNLERQAEEKAPISRAGAFGAAVPGAALEVASTFIPLGRGLVGKLLGPKADEFLRKGSEEAIERAARESLTTSLTKGAGVGALAEIPTEVAQQMLERYQAGLSLTDEQALKEYGEAAYGAGLVGGPFGAAARGLGRPGARAEFERQQQEEAQRLAVSDEELAQRFPDILPGGFKIEEQELGREMAPAGYSILAEGREEPLSVVDTAEEAQAKLESLTQIREQERAKLLEEDQKIDTDVQKAQARLEQLEATEQAGTEEYQTLKADLPRMMDEAAQKKAELFDRVEKLGAPLSVTPIGEVERVNKQFNVVAPTGTVLQSYATLGEAEADVRKMFGEEAFDLKKKNIETARELYKNFVPQMRKFGLGDVGLNIVDRIENGAGGSYLNKLITTSLEDANPIQTMRHESLHAMKDLGFFTPQQWKALEERASKEWIKKYLEGQETEIDGQKMSRLEGYRKLGYSEQDIVEEAIADAFGDYDKGAKPPPGLIAALFRKIKNFFSSLGQALRGAGFQSAEDIFQGIEQGKLKPAKVRAKEEPSAKPKSSLKKANLIPLNLIAGPAASSYVPEYVTPLKEAVAQGKSKSISLKDGTTINLVSGQDINEKDKFAVVALDKQGDEVGRLSFYENKDGTLSSINVGVKEEMRRKGLAMALYDAAEEMGAVFPSAEDKSFRTEEGQAFREARAKAKSESKLSLAKPSEWKATKADIKQADEYFDENGIMPYTSEGQIDVPLDKTGVKYSIKKPYDQKAMAKDQTLKNDPLTGLPMNANGTVTLYFPTDNAGARDLAKTKRLKGATPEANRVYLTNESSAAAVQAKPGMIDQPLGGANVLLQVDPSLLHVLEEYEDGRKDFFIPIAEGQYFAKKMAQTKMFTLNAPRTKGLHPDRTLSQVTKMVNDTADKWASASKKERAEMAKEAKAILRDQHNIEKLFGANSKLEKTNIGDYGLTYNGKKVMSTGLGFASAQKINDEQRATTCPQSAICESLCLGETSGQNLLYGGEGEFRSGPRLSQFLKTEALVVNPEAFSIMLIKQIENFRNAAKKLGYQPAIRLNVTSDFNPKTFENIIKMFPDVMFYDYTKLDTKPIASNHHLTYSSTGASQIVNGEVVFNKESNWDRMVDKVLSNGKNVAMAFTSRNDMPKAIFDERTGKTFQVWNGDEYDARFLDPVREDGDGWIIGLTNKDNTTKPEDAAKKHNGFFLDYDAKRDGDTLVIRNQAELKPGGEAKPAGKVFPIAKLSLKNVRVPTGKEAKEAVKAAGTPNTEAFKLFNAGNQWVDADGKPKVFYHATARDFFEFTPAGQSQAIFLAETPEEAETFGSIAEDKLRREVYSALGLKEDKLKFLQGVVDRAVEKGTITKKEGDEFMKQANRKTPAYGDFGDIEQDVYDALIELSPTRMSIMPLYARAMTPFDFENKEHVDQVMNWVANNTQYPQDFPEKWLNGMKGRISQGLWQAIEDKRVQQAIRALGFDAFTVRENRASPKNYAVYKPNQVKSVTGNLGDFNIESKDIRYSLPTLSADTMKRINEVTPGRYEPGWKERVIGGFKQDYTSLRQKFLNRYEALAVLDRRLREQMRQSGGPALLADQSAEFAALQSDLAAGVTASAMGIGDRQGGIPVYKNGFTTIDTSVKGLTEALAPLAKYGDPEIYQRYQFWAGWKRGRRLLREGREQVYTPADAKLAQEIEAKHPEFVQVQKDLVAFNNGIVNFAVQTGVLSRERAQVYTKYADYIPFYRQLDLDKTIGPNPFSGISGLRGPKELKGGEAPLGDFMENLVRNTQSMINAGMKNAAAQKATKVALQLKNVMVERLPGPAKGVGYDVYTVLENGELVYYRSADPLFIDALKSLNMPDLPFMGLLSAPANVLRNLVTKDPGFMMANLLRDSLSSYVTSGQNVTPIVGTMVNFGKALSGKDKNLQTLFNAGVIGGYEFSQNVEQSGKSLSADLNKKAGKDAKLLRPFKSLWEGLEKGTTASDAATRMAVYERVMKETGNEAEAISRALEVMNFNRKGNSILIRIATAAIPFFNARLQGLDLFYRASTGRMDTQDAQEIKRKFWVRGMTMASLSVMYYMSVAGDDEYEKQEEETKDNNWIFPSLGIRVPIPFEVGTLFKTMPERITAYLMGNDTGKELKESTIRALANTFAFNPIPQTFKPIIEVATNYNFFTMRPIVGQGMQDVAPQFQVGPGTSKTAEYLGGFLNVSPLKLDQLIKGYTGTIGGYVTDVVDAMASEFSDVPKASKRFEQMPIIKRFALDPEARGSVTQFYELQKSVDTFVRTANLLEKTARPEEYAKYVQENLDMLAAKAYISGVEKGMKELREMKRLINTLDIPPDEKRDLLVDLGRAENNLTANTKTIKKAFSELK